MKHRIHATSSINKWHLGLVYSSHHHQNHLDNMKALFFLAFLALVASTSFAQYAEAPSGDVEGPSAGGYEKWAAEAPSGDVEGPSAGGYEKWVAKAPTMSTSEQCEHEHMKLDSCRDYLMDWCTPKGTWITWPWEWMKSSCEEIRKRCCQQLGQMASQCRCKAIFRTIQGELGGFGSQEGQKARVMAMAQRLPSKCNVVPRSCNIPITSGYYW
ncbi:hypothetical protein QYE76_000322 [Lolium multiflorum]|uniref:Bifunctional inhibitor/plant lipid transfer protein/seed storage helical domain-containing protein n=2 Tax=Lolium TaxID=4520 RepID=A0AAD8RKY0_LOLMU|nr:hypothetical protein QYE76_000322 [Lolium multiflorum]